MGLRNEACNVYHNKLNEPATFEYASFDVSEPACSQKSAQK